MCNLLRLAGAFFASALLLSACGDSRTPSNAYDAGTGQMGDAGPWDSGWGSGNDAGTFGPIEALSDEFGRANSISNWTVRHMVEGTPSLFKRLEFNTTLPGFVVIEPFLSGWFEASKGTFLYKQVDGHFVMQTRVNAGNTGNRTLPPTSPFNSAGLMARNPASASGPENYIMYNVGYQQDEDGVATEAKNTLDDDSAQFFAPGLHSGVLVICRIGSTFEMWRKLDDETTWNQTNTFVREDLPSTLQVGIVVNGFEGPVDITAEFDYVRFTTVTQPSSCSANLPPRG